LYYLYRIITLPVSSFIDSVLQPPSYGWQDADGMLIKPSPRQLLAEFFSRVNIFKSKKNWLPFTAWLWVLMLIPFLYLFIFKYFSWWLLLTGFIYSMVLMGTHGTIWYHRYCTHQAFQFKNGFWRFITQHLVIKLVPEEIYVVSHHVHHSKSDEPGDPYNANAGWLYCFLADVNHQPVAKGLDKDSYDRLAALLNHTGVKKNSYRQYQKWGSVANPFYTVAEWLLNWSFWYFVFYLIGGNALACTLFGAAVVWAVGVRTFNFEGHGKGHDKRQNGVDFDRRNMSINQYWPGFVAGEWHNNHHLYPSSARAGFLFFQIDLAWCYVYLLYLAGGVKSYHNSRKQFFNDYYNPYKREKALLKKSK
jgi:fatty-acid desaturase